MSLTVSRMRPYNLTQAELKSDTKLTIPFGIRYEIFCVGPKDSDGDYVPDSLKLLHGMDPKHRDTDRGWSI